MQNIEKQFPRNKFQFPNKSQVPNFNNQNFESIKGMKNEARCWKKNLQKIWSRVLGIRKSFWKLVAFVIVASRKFWKIDFNFKGRKIRLGWIVLAVILILILVLGIVKGLNKNSIQTTTYKNKVYDYKVEVPAGFQVQQDVLGNTTLTQQSGEGNCLVHIVDPRKIDDGVGLENWVRTYLSQQDERFDYDLEQVEFKGYQQGVKIYIKNNAPKGQSWYFLRDKDRVFIYKVWKHHQGEGDCEEWLRMILD